MMVASNVLMVTRERSEDRRYGLGRSLMPVVRALQSRSWRVRYLCQEDMPDSTKADRAQWIKRLNRLPGLAGMQNRSSVLAALAERLHVGWFAAQIARREGFTVVHLHDPWLALGFRLGVRILSLKGIRWGVTEHGFGCYSRATHEDGLLQGPRLQRWLRRMEMSTLAAAHWVTAPTQLSLVQVARDLALPFNPSHWKVISHGACQEVKPSRESARLALGWGAEDIYLLGVGRFAPLKRFDLMVNAWVTLASRYTNLHLQLLGGTTCEHLERAASAAGLSNRLHFSVVEDVKPYLAAADIYVSTSSTESFGLANFEALQAGLPCICTAVGGVPEVMGQGAWLIPVEQVALESALDTLINQPLQRKQWSERAATQARQAPDVETVTSQYAEIFTH